MDEMVKVYWQPGCSSCLKTKEFLDGDKHKTVDDKPFGGGSGM